MCWQTNRYTSDPTTIPASLAFQSMVPREHGTLGG